jgi:enoyl-CoA hydratase
VLRIQRPEVLNALSRTVLQELSDALDELEDDASVQGIILTGAGDKAFVAGADISEIKALSPSQVAAFSTYGQQLFARIEQFAKPIVALVNGFALGGGCELSMACHLRVATPKAKFGQPEVNLGIIAGYGGTQRLPRLIGKTKAMELLLTGDMIKAEEAERLGLVNAVKPEEEAMDYALALLGKIYQKAPLAVAATITSVNAAFDPAQDGYQVEAAQFAKTANSHDGKEGTSAFLEKRTPVFTGA